MDDIQKELDKVSSSSQVDNELAALKAELGTGSDGTGPGGGEAAALPAAGAEPTEAAGSGEGA